jgi:hypothetical protein
MSYIFKLRKGVRWQNKAPVERPRAHGGRRGVLRGAFPDGLRKCQCLHAVVGGQGGGADKYTSSFTLKEP